MMTIARREVYNIFDVSRSSFEDLKQRLIKTEMLWKHQSTDTEGREILIFGATAFREEK